MPHAISQRDARLLVWPHTALQPVLSLWLPGTWTMQSWAFGPHYADGLQGVFSLDAHELGPGSLINLRVQDRFISAHMTGVIIDAQPGNVFSWYAHRSEIRLATIGPRPGGLPLTPLERLLDYVSQNPGLGGERRQEDHFTSGGDEQERTLRALCTAPPESAEPLPQPHLGRVFRHDAVFHDEILRHRRDGSAQACAHGLADLKRRHGHDVVQFCLRHNHRPDLEHVYCWSMRQNLSAGRRLRAILAAADL
jgi:hypothetical protein